MYSSQPKILIIDDDTSTIRLMGEILGDYYDVSFATSAEQGLELANGNNDSIDLILLDIKMPGIDGYNLCRRLKRSEATKRIPIIFVTSCSKNFEEAFGFHLGAVDYITKPINAEILKARVKTHVTLYRQARKLEELSSIDPLTATANRRKFEDTLDKEWKSSTRSGSPLSLIILDVDNFKSYNDHYGHGLGDKCLEKIGRLLNNTCQRSNDLAARIGGEEFAVILPNTNEIGALEFAETLRRGILSLEIPHEESDAGPFVTASIGVCSCQASPPFSKEDLFKEADQQMYLVKNKRKNSVSGTTLN